MAGQANREDCGVSVAIASYNGAAYLPALLRSLEEQTWRPAEIVVADDASTDDTVAILERFGESSGIPVRVYRQPKNVGIIQNFISAFRMASSPLVAYCDQDDVWAPEKIERCARILADGRAALVRHASMIVDGELNPTGAVSHQEAGDYRYRFPAVSLNFDGWGHQMVFTRATVETLLALYECETFRGAEFGTCFDAGLPFAASFHGDIVLLAEPLVKVRRHAQATSEAGLHWGGGEGMSAKLAHRAQRVARRGKALQMAQDIIGACGVAGARDFQRSSAAYEDALRLSRLRQNLIAGDGVLARAGAFARVAFATLKRAAVYGDVRLREFVGDALTMLYGAGPRAGAPARSS
jgi:glycosyltransferase involved in cell wall biosynthesis